MNNCSKNFFFTEIQSKLEWLINTNRFGLIKSPSYSDELVDQLVDCLRSGSKIFQKSSPLILITGTPPVFVLLFVSSQATTIFCLSIFVELLSAVTTIVSLTINPTTTTMRAISNLFIMHDVIFNILFRYDEIAMPLGMLAFTNNSFNDTEQITLLRYYFASYHI